ncbi:hypothetical protein SARC_07286 [Sphaeroforma arctica JP610]|uniref:Uncharacterized protein n=1 Tax=Sphaeroforma arctica JP610 TaxID=667725 RepID=A0A0L0FUW1_9EUKA|nr:hypothetical protein SARC_07286 [Sphaeroforma arctica JP610]KNC80351.1 hypothetical protein SARC_07286 [Sphaeroforma arctica JP610]|eukprot:XP_014154253.1 hypothetical protein SARC_07286 [Sphaeroforma arctica JP610]
MSTRHESVRATPIDTALDPKPSAIPHNCRRNKRVNYENFGAWFIGLKLELELFGVIHHLHSKCSDSTVGGCSEIVADSKCRRIMIDSIDDKLVTTVYKNHLSEAPWEFFEYICITNNTGSQGRFWNGIKKRTNFTATGITESSMQAL